MRKILFVVALAAFLSLFGWSVFQKERQMHSGTVMILALRPVDPRSLLQGDYMVLHFVLERDIDNALRALKPARPDSAARKNGQEENGAVPPSSQKAVLRLDPAGEAVFVELDTGRSLAKDEHLLAFNTSEDTGFGAGRVSRIGAGTFFFQEGHGRAYQQAKYAEMRVDSQGGSLITHLLDAQKKRIDPHKAE